MEYYTYYSSPVGKLLITAEAELITGLWFEKTAKIPENGIFTDSLPIFQRLCGWLDEYFDGASPDASILPLKLDGTPFQMLVWELLREIPYGKSTTYGSLAKLAAKKQGKTRMSAQAVGNAVVKNPISIIIPCHRVLGIGGNLTGYAGGLDKKRFLLNLERIQYK